jgi:glucokinase
VGKQEEPLIGAVDIGGTKIAVGIINDEGKVLSRRECPTRPELGYSHALKNIEEMLQATSNTAGVQIRGIGIGSTGPVLPMTGAFGDVNFFPHWIGKNPVDDLSRIFHVKVALENDADAAALGEAEWGAGKNKKRLIYATIGTGIGTGLIIDGQLYRGVDDSHPEVGHHLIDPSGPPCVCGFRGCWESFAAGPAMVNWLTAEAPADYPHRDGLTAKRICELAVAGDTWARKAADREGYYLGLGIANLVTMFTPDSVVLGGSIMKSASLFMDTVRKMVQQCCRLVPNDRTELALASLGEDSNLIGAARVWHHRFSSEGGPVGH